MTATDDGYGPAEALSRWLDGVASIPAALPSAIS